MDFNELINYAKSVLGSRKISENAWVGSVAAAILSDSGKVYTGVCIDLACSIGFCAEHAAIAAMITAGESKIIKIVAISENGILPPCGRCREFISQIHADNIKTEIMIAPDKVMLLDDLLPFRWDR
jgi:cytidine deaminase